MNIENKPVFGIVFQQKTADSNQRGFPITESDGIHILA